MTFDILLSPPDVGDLEESFVVDAIRSGWVAPLGPQVDMFEREMSERIGGSRAVALSSGTAGLHLALLAVGVRPGDEVVVSTLTFAATAFAVTYVGAVPVFIDSEPIGYNMDPELLRSFLADRASTSSLPACVISVDIFGQTADYEPLVAVCEEFGVPLVEDAAESLGATHVQGPAGSFGRVAVFSFNGNKIMTTSGGGMLLAHDDEMADRVRHLATQARMPFPWYEHEEVGFNYRMSNVLAALGRAQLMRLDGMIRNRRLVRSHYQDRLAEHGIDVLTDAPWGQSNCWLTVCRLAPAAVEPTRLRLEARGIEARRVWKPMHRQPVFATNGVVLSGVSDELFDSGLCLPSGSRMTPQDLDRVVDAVVTVAEG